MYGVGVGEESDSLARRIWRVREREPSQPIMRREVRLVVSVNVAFTNGEVGSELSVVILRRIL